jgi:hypothetical protein
LLLCTGEFFYEQYRILSLEAPYGASKQFHHPTTVVHLQFLFLTTHPACTRVQHAGDRHRQSVCPSSIKQPASLHSVFPFLQSDSYKITKPYIAPFDHEDRPQTLLVCGRRLAVLQERRCPISKPKRENLFRFGNYFVTDDEKATTKTVVGDEKVPAVIFFTEPCNPRHKHRSLHTTTIA